MDPTLLATSTLGVLNLGPKKLFWSFSTIFEAFAFILSDDVYNLFTHNFRKFEVWLD